MLIYSKLKSYKFLRFRNTNKALMNNHILLHNVHKRIYKTENVT